MPARQATRTYLICFLAASALGAGALRAQEDSRPVSDWLSNSVTAPETARSPGSDIVTSALPGEIEVRPLDRPRADAVGLFPPGLSGLPADLWGPTTSDDVIASLAPLPDHLLPALRDLLMRILLAELHPPVDSGSGDRLFLARVDKLLAMGALAEAGALLEAADPFTPERFRRYFDVALLTGHENTACERLLDEPEVAPTYPTRIFCLARGGDWPAAAVTLETAEALGILDPKEDMLLARFLESDIVDHTGDPPPRLPSPLQFQLYEAIGEPILTGSLPLAYAHADLRDNRGWKARIEAAERLARFGAFPAEALVSLYTERRPSASGGVWDRALAVQQLDRALNENNAREITGALETAWGLMQASDLVVPFARVFGPRLIASSGVPDSRELIFEIGLLSKDYRTVGETLRPSSPRHRFLAAVAQGTPWRAPPPDLQAQAITQGFAATTPPRRLLTLLSENRRGEAILRAIALFSEGVEGDPDGVADAIALLRYLGLRRSAERAALELMILSGRP